MRHEEKSLFFIRVILTAGTEETMPKT
jgi:hypothetical protein